MRTHKSFLAMILADEGSNFEQDKGIQDHLAKCSECRHFAEQWQTARGLLSEPSMAVPRTGFPGRWKALAKSHQRETMIQPRRLWLVVTSGSMLVVALGFLFWNGVANTGWVSAGRNIASSAVSNILEAFQAFNIFSWNLEQLQPIGIWMLGIGVIFGLSFLWLVVVRWIATRNDNE